MLDGDIVEMSFDEAARTDGRSVKALVSNALNELHIALHRPDASQHHIAIVNAIAELEKVQ